MTRDVKVLRNQNTINLFWDDSKLTSYLDTALVPMVRQLKDHPALGFWEVSTHYSTPLNSDQGVTSC